MAAPSPKFQKLLAKLRELFELDKADLDFGLYRVLRARRDEIDKFLREELLPQVQGELGVVTEEKIKPLEAKVEEEIAKVMEYGGKTREEAEASDKVIAAKSLLEQSRNPAALEDEVYSLLTTFFGRYYEAGDFISQRRYSGPGKEKYMLPYNGEEVKLVWANMDQYYIKSAENFRDYTFRAPALEPDEPVPVPDFRPRVSFKLIEADTEKDNVKAAAATGKRTFALADPAHHPLELTTEDGLSVLRIPFTYAVRDKEDKQDALLAATEAAVLESATVPDDLKKHLSAKAPTGTRADRTVLAKHLEAYAAKNSFDYFIHKDLGGFLTRELDYFLKSELLRVDDLLTHDDHQRALTLKKARAFRKVAEKIVTFLHRQEQFQKKLWLKKKFVVSTDYAITLDRIPEEFYPEIAANDAQREEWVKLHSIDEIKKDTTTPGYTVPLTVEFLKAHQSLMVDTRNFLVEFKLVLVGSLENTDDQEVGTVLNADNFAGLRFLKNKKTGKIKGIYIDPPYNTGGDDFAYRDNLQHSSWVTFIADRLSSGIQLMSESAGGYCNLNDIEDWRFRGLVEGGLGGTSYITTVITKCSTASSFRTVNTGPVDVTDRIIIFSKNRSEFNYTPQPVPKPVDLQHFSRFITNKSDDPSEWVFKSIRLQVIQNLGFAVEKTAEGMKLARQKWGNAAKAIIDEASAQFAIDNADKVFETKTLQKPSPWLRQFINESNSKPSTIVSVPRDNQETMYLVGGRQFYFLERGIAQVGGEKFVCEPASTLWDDINTNNLKHEGAVEFPSGKKPLKLVERFLRMSDSAEGEGYLDFFAGSGTTAHAVINLNREDAGTRKYFLIEMGDHFDTVLVPRIKKVVYSPDWRDGKPTTRDKGISHCVKILKLESYEDCLNNLELTRSADQKDLLSRNPGLREDYLLGYFLDVETRGSVLKLDHFRDPWNYRMKIATGSVGETRETPIDLVETFNWLLGLTVQHQSNLQHRRPDKGFAEDEHGRLQLTGGLTRAADPAKDKDSRTFQTIEGTLRSGEKVLVIWRSLTQPQKDEDTARLLEEDNVMLEAFLSRTALNPREKQWDLIYVNGDHTLDNLAERLAEDPENTAPRFKVRTIEPEFHRLMFEGTED